MNSVFLPQFTLRPLALQSIVLLCLSLTAMAEPLSVQTTQLIAQDSYLVERTYGGQLKPRRMSKLGFEFAGVVAEVHADDGDTVEKGTPLASMEADAMTAQLHGSLSNVATARANITAQKAQLKLSQATLVRYENLVATGHASPQRLDELRMQQNVDKSQVLVLQTRLGAAESELSLVEVNVQKLVIRAPYTGTIQSRLIDEGSIVSPGQTALVLVESGKSEARVGIPETMVQHLKQNVTYEFKVNQQAVRGSLKAVLPQIDEETGTVTAIFNLDGDRLFTGSLTEMTMRVEVREPGFWVPLNSLAESQRGLWSLLVVKDNIVESRLVEVLHRGADAVYVRGTISDGDLIVASGTSRVVPGQSVSIAGAVGK